MSSLLNLLGNLSGLRDPVVDDDRELLPFVGKALRDAGYSEVIGDKVSGFGWQHSIRRLGDDKILKFPGPQSVEIISLFVEHLREDREILNRYLSAHLSSDKYIYVLLENGQATYAVVKDWVEGHPLADLSDAEIESRPEIAASLVDLLESGERMYRETGLALDLAEPGGLLRHWLSPRRTGNIIISADGRAVYIDTILIPRKFDPASMSPLYRLIPVWRFVYRFGVRPRLRRFLGQLSVISGAVRMC